MGSSSPVTRRMAVEELAELGVTGPFVYLIDLIPLVEMAWADGTAQQGEIEILQNHLESIVSRINAVAGYTVMTLEQGREFLHRFLAERPAPALLKKLRSYVSAVQLREDGTEAAGMFNESLLAACLDIAASADDGKPHDNPSPFDPAEKRCFFEILESLG